MRCGINRLRRTPTTIWNSAPFFFLTRGFSFIVVAIVPLDSQGEMRPVALSILAATLLLALTTAPRGVVGQSVSSASVPESHPVQRLPSPSNPVTETMQLKHSDAPLLTVPKPSLTAQPLFDFGDSDIKFKLETLMKILRDSRHEGWVLAAYPDPKTSRPLIGAGFGLDVAAVEHLQRDPLNPHTFLEPSSAELWQAAGLTPERLERILDQYDHNLARWKKKNFRRRIKTHQLSPELTEEEATRLLRVSAIEAIHNAQAYCRDFDQLTAAQQMALSELVFQMGVNLEEFVQFLAALNGNPVDQALLQPMGAIEGNGDHWKTVQSTLIQSKWARLYTSRAITVIAMFDPHYDNDPRKAERQVQAVLHPPVAHHHRKSHVASTRAGSDSRRGDQAASRRARTS